MELITPEIGSFSDLPGEIYHSWDAASNSLLGEMDEKSPAHARLKMSSILKSEALQFGSMFHSKILEPEIFKSKYILMPKLDKRKPADKERFAELCEAYGEDNLVDPKTWRELELAYDSVFNNSTARKLVESLILREHSIAWIHEKSGALCKARLDGVTKQGIVVDFKTTQSAARSDFASSVYNFGYHRQGAHYLRAARAAEIEAKHFIIIAVEKGTGFVANYELDLPTILAGENQLDRLLPIWKKCSESGVWPSYPSEIQKINIPTWAINKLNDKTIGE